MATEPASAGYRDDVGYTALQSELGSAVPTGAGVVVSQVEGAVSVNGTDTWMPDPTVGDFIGKTITSVTAGAPAGVYSGHATAVGTEFYGNSTGLANGVITVNAYDANRWTIGDFLWTTAVRRPYYAASRVVNHSWVGNAGSSTSEVLRRLDWVIENDDMIHVTGLANGTGPVGQPSTFPLLASAFNSIAVGQSEGLHQIGSVAVDAVYTAGRTRPDIVVPAQNTSLATARVSSAVALLVQTGHAVASSPSYTNRAGLLIRNAERVEVIRSALMAGADRATHNSSSANLALYRDSAANHSPNGLDYRYGAGQLNVYNSYSIVASGEKNSQEDGGAGSGTANRGFDYDPAFGGSGSANSSGTYALPVSAQPQLLTASLVWNLDIHGGTQSPNSFNDTATVRNLDLLVIDVSAPSSPVTVYASQSTTDNTENAWLVIPAGASYVLKVASDPAVPAAYDYGIAWQLLPDSDADGAHDGKDNCILMPNGPLVPDAGGNSQRDTNGDGFGNICDADLNNSGLVTVTDYNMMRASLNTTNPDADLDGSGLVTSSDFYLQRTDINAPPGPSAYAQ